jgi:hypothetical protein
MHPFIDMVQAARPAARTSIPFGANAGNDSIQPGLHASIAAGIRRNAQTSEPFLVK